MLVVEQGVTRTHARSVLSVVCIKLLQSKDRLDYFIDCMYHPVKDELYFVGGTNRY